MLPIRKIGVCALVLLTSSFLSGCWKKKTDPASSTETPSSSVDQAHASKEAPETDATTVALTEANPILHDEESEQGNRLATPESTEEDSSGEGSSEEPSYLEGEETSANNFKTAMGKDPLAPFQ